MRRIPRWLPLLAVLALFALFAAAGGLETFRTESVVARYDQLRALVDADRTLAMSLFVGVQAFLAGLVVFPAIFVMWVAGGLMFGAVAGAGLSAIAVTIGGTVSFLVVRTAFADDVARLMGERGRRFREALLRDGVLYLIILRTSPMPFWIVTLAAAAAGLRARTFMLATLLGVIPPCLVWANVGSGLGDVIATGGEPSLSMLGDAKILWPLTALSAFGVISVGLRYWMQRRARVLAASPGR